MIIKERMTAIMPDTFVVFLIGMRMNKIWKINKWWRVAMAMPKMIKELIDNKEMGFISGHAWFGTTIIMLQYWESFEKLDAYAKNKTAKHLPAWQAFNRHIKSSGDVGIWHETYLISKGNYEAFYHNMPAFGLGKAGELVEAKGSLQSAKDRIKQ